MPELLDQINQIGTIGCIASAPIYFALEWRRVRRNHERKR